LRVWTMREAKELYIIISTNELWNDAQHNYKETCWRQQVVLMVEGQDKTISEEDMEQKLVGLSHKLQMRIGGIDLL